MKGHQTTRLTGLAVESRSWHQRQGQAVGVKGWEDTGQAQEAGLRTQCRWGPGPHMWQQIGVRGWSHGTDLGAEGECEISRGHGSLQIGTGSSGKVGCSGAPRPREATR